MKKFIALILAAFMLVGCLGCFAGCGRDVADEAPVVSSADTVVSDADATEPVVDEPVVDASATDMSATDVSVTDMSATDM